MTTSAHLLIICLAAQAVAADITIHPDKANSIALPAGEARYVRMVILAGSGAQPCIDELEVYGPDGKVNLALASGFGGTLWTVLVLLSKNAPKTTEG